MRNQRIIIDIVAMPALLLLVIAALAIAGPADTPNTFTPGTVADANAVNANFTAHADAITDNDARINDLLQDVQDNQTDILTNLTDISTNQTDITTNQTDIDQLDTDVGDLDTRVTTLEGAQTSADMSYDNSTSGLTATDAQAAIDEIASATGGSGQVFIRWGTTTAPTGTTKLYDGLAVTPPDGGDAFVMKGTDAGAAASGGQALQFLATSPTTTNMPSGVTANRRIVACVCYSATPTTVIYGTHTAPTGWSVLYKGYVMSNGNTVICVDMDSFDASQTAGSESTREMVTTRIQSTHDSTNYPHGRHIKAAVIAKN